ncbi:MAG: hemolysin III family protein [Coriobacteriia bacterium]|nr:hemolysin III family protein [Coriobacteriia bacterium]
MNTGETTTVPNHSILITQGESSFKLKDPVSALTHAIGCIAAVAATPPLVLLGAQRLGGAVEVGSLAVFVLSMILLYAASATYHTFDIPGRINRVLKKVDHCMVFVLIAGTYTPVCILTLDPAVGIPLLGVVWGIAVVGMVFKLFWVYCPRWVSSVLYIGMGWVCVFALPAIITGMTGPCFAWLLVGGVAYTVGGVIYALKLPVLEQAIPGFGAHELFHLFVLVGSACHYVCLYSFVLGA